ncbi:isoaspartyl peptidase L-asparaginase, partial [Paramuricea clavata]
MCTCRSVMQMESRREINDDKRTYFHNIPFYLYVCKHVTFVHHKLSSWQPKKISSGSVGDYSSTHNNKQMAKNPAQGNPNQEGISVPAEMMECERKPRIIVQGGMYTDLQCGGAQLQNEFMDALKGAARNGYDVLRDNGTAVDAVEKAILSLEENGRFNAGRGSYKTDKGDVECDAMIMDGHKVDAGAVTAARYILHPVSLARKVMDESDHCTLCADGALEFAVNQNVPIEFVEGRDYFPWDGPNRFNDNPGDTVTAIAMDCKGNLACAASS